MNQDYDALKEQVRNQEKLQQTKRTVFNRLITKALPPAVISTIKHALALGFTLVPNKDGTYFLSPPQNTRKSPTIPKELRFPQIHNSQTEIAEYEPGRDGKASPKSMLKLFVDGKVFLPATKNKEEVESIDIFSKRLKAAGWTQRRFLRQGRRLNANDWKPAGKLRSVVCVLIDDKQVVVPIEVSLKAMLQPL